MSKLIGISKRCFLWLAERGFLGRNFSQFIRGFREKNARNRHRLTTLQNALDVDFVSSRIKLHESHLYVPRYSDEVAASRIAPKVIAYYLPQFHPIPENDAWWGKGFTEWTNVTKARPQFVDHYQPRLPSELGFYDLRLGEVQEEQIKLAAEYGLSGFCFHYYWFNGRKLLEKPIYAFLENKSLKLDFCLCWANENWTRRWDGSENEVLIAQNHIPEDDLRFIDELINFFRDERYIKIDGKPVLVVYRANILPDPRATAARWRTRVKELGFKDIFLLAARSFDVVDSEAIGFDALVEFPPHQIDASDITSEVDLLNNGFRGTVYSYKDVRPKPLFNQSLMNIPCVIPSWDNEARKPGRGSVFHGASPGLFGKMLDQAFKRSELLPESSQFVFVNGWNEWGEGACLEPDRKFGFGNLQAVRASIQASACRRLDREIWRKDVNLGFVPKSKAVALVHAHFVEDLCGELASYLTDTQAAGMDLLITLRGDLSEAGYKVVRSLYPQAFIMFVENRGRDVRPFIIGLKKAEALGYEIFFKCHTKRSPQLINGTKWRDRLWSNHLNGKDGIIAILSEIASSTDVGILYHPAERASCAVSDVNVNNRFWLDMLLRRLGRGADVDGYNFMFPSGSMFWGRVGAFRALTDSSILSLDDFEFEAGQLDGTAAHALERLFEVIVNCAGYRYSDSSRLSDEYAPESTGREGIGYAQIQRE